MCTPTPRSAASAAALRQGVVAAREGGVYADHAATTGAQEPLVLGQPPAGTIGAVTIGDAVRKVVRTPTCAQASAMIDRLPSMHDGDSW